MAEKKYEYSAKDFREPLLWTLGALTDFTPFRAVRLTETYGPICELKKIKADDFGQLEGKPAVHQWIQWAYRDLKNQGYASSQDSAGIGLRRGWWALTQKGVDKAREHSGVDPEDKEPEPETVEEEKVEEVVGEETYEGYHPDPYIRALATEQTPCFGHFDSTESVCNKCLLKVECGVHLRTELAAFCRRAENRWAMDSYQPSTYDASEDPKTAGSQDDPLPVPPATPGPEVKPPKRPKATGNAVVTKTVAESVCFVCGKIIEEGVDSMWVREHRGDQGICCLGCYEAEVSEG
jgi:hypothetical protein